jgi:hypothetical protein
MVATETVEFALIFWKGRRYNARHLAVSFLDANFLFTSWLLTAQHDSKVATEPTQLLYNEVRNFKYCRRRRLENIPSA